MLRDKSLIPLSRQHQHALALCVRIDRASPIRDSDLEMWQEEIAQHFKREIETHFSAEEAVVFPVARRCEELAPLVEDLLADHSALRQGFASAMAKTLSAEGLPDFARRLSAHIRKEERQLFERAQELLSVEELASLGQQLEHALQRATNTCILPSDTTRLQGQKYNQGG